MGHGGAVRLLDEADPHALVALADLATEKGVDIAKVQAAVQAAEVAETKTAIQSAVTAGTITQAKADWLLSGLDKGYWGPGAQGGDFGFGMGMGGHGGAFFLDPIGVHQRPEATQADEGDGRQQPRGIGGIEASHGRDIRQSVAAFRPGGDVQAAVSVSVRYERNGACGEACDNSRR